MNAAVIVFPGSNREHDVADAIERATGRQPKTVWHRETELPAVDLIVLPGGFAYGDYLRTGAIAARSPIMSEVRRRASRGTVKNCRVSPTSSCNRANISGLSLCA